MVLSEHIAQKLQKPWFRYRNSGFKDDFVMKTKVLIKTMVLNEPFAQNLQKPSFRYRNPGFEDDFVMKITSLTKAISLC